MVWKHCSSLFNIPWFHGLWFIPRHCDIHIMRLLPLIGIFTIITISFDTFGSEARDRRIQYNDHIERQRVFRRYVSSLIIQEIRSYDIVKPIDKAMNKVTNLDVEYKNTRLLTRLDVIIPAITSTLLHDNGNQLYVIGDLGHDKYYIGLSIPLK